MRIRVALYDGLALGHSTASQVEGVTPLHLITTHFQKGMWRWHATKICTCTTFVRGKKTQKLQTY